MKSDSGGKVDLDCRWQLHAIVKNTIAANTDVGLLRSVIFRLPIKPETTDLLTSHVESVFSSCHMCHQEERSLHLT